MRNEIKKQKLAQFKARKVEKELTQMREEALEKIIDRVLSRQGIKEQGEQFIELMSKEDLKSVLLHLRKDIAKGKKEANENLDKYLKIVWDQYLATSFDHADIINGKQYAQRIVVTELLKVLYNSVLTEDQKVELITAAQVFFLATEKARNSATTLMSDHDIVIHII